MAATGVSVKEVATQKIDGQKTGTSGLRKKAKEFSSGNYLANWVQSLFNALPAEQRARCGRQALLEHV
jgi:phosphoglucomutase